MGAALMLSAMGKLISHIVAFAAVTALCIAVWVLTSGSSSRLQGVIDDPTSAVSAGFWPVWVILVWGTLLVIHAGFFVSGVISGKALRRRRARRTNTQKAVDSAREFVEQSRSLGTDIVGEVRAALDKAHTDRQRRGPSRSRPRGPRPPVVPVSVPSKEPQRRWVTVMFTDIADSTHHNERMGDEEWHKVLGQVRAVVRSAVAERNGAEVGTAGDGLLARFESPADAVLCGVDIQSELNTARDASDFVPEVRIGVHAGEAVEDEGDLIGRVINLASRVTDQADPGEIWVTEPVADQLVGRLELEDKGLRELKGLAQPRHLLAVKWS